MDRTVSRLIAGHQHNRPISHAQQQHRPQKQTGARLRRSLYVQLRIVDTLNKCGIHVD